MAFEALKNCLDDTGDLHKRFLECLEIKMGYCKNVNIAKVSADVTRELGKPYGDLASKAMWAVAPKTKIHIEDNDARSS